MPSKKEYKMTQRILSKLMSHNNSEVLCGYCKKPIKVGDEVVSITQSRHRTSNILSVSLRGSHRKIYHKRCFEEVEKRRI